MTRPHRRAPTLRDVARAAMVSTTTASDALRDQGRISAETRATVRAVADRLGYTPNRSAQSLRTSRTWTLGLHIPEFLTRSEYYMSFVFGAAEQAARADYNMTLISTRHVPERDAGHGVDGLVLCDPIPTDPVVQQLMAASVPITTCERYPGVTQPSGVVRSDHESMMRQLLDHLCDAGATRPALLASGAPTDWSTSLQRAYRAWCDEHGIGRSLSQAPFGSSADVLQTTVRDMLESTPAIDALICAADGAAAAVLPTIRQCGRVPGTDLLLASCVDSTAMRHADPPITAIDMHPRQVGAECAKLLCDIIRGHEAADAERLQPIELVVRESTSGRS